jgi:hypothetical protein
MASEAQIRANRLNAKRSTGPRTADGRARSAQNARKHGLAAGPSSPFGPEVERLAKALAGEFAPPDLMRLARRIAQSSVQLALLQGARALVWQRPPSEAGDDGVLQELRRLERYESRALSSRDRALREFTAIQKALLSPRRC